MRLRQLGMLALPLFLLLLSCGQNVGDTYVLLNFETGSASLLGVTRIDVVLKAGERTNQATFEPGGEIAFPTSTTMAFGNAEGKLEVVASAKNQAAQVVGWGSGSIELVAGTTSMLTLQLEPVPSLSGLSFSAGTLDPAFAPETQVYTLTVPTLVDEVQVTATVSDAAAKLLIDGTPVGSGGGSQPLTIGPGVTMVSVAVQGPGGAERVYGIAVMRRASPYLKASNTESNDWFGSSVSLSGDTLAVGAYVESSNATGINGNQANNSAQASGAVYVFVRSGSQWSQQAYLKASNADAVDRFGYSVSLSGDTLAVGTWGEDSNATGVNGNQADNSASSSGAVYVFVRSGSQWSQQAYLKASNTGADDNFGSTLSLFGDTLAVGASGEDSNATGVNGNQADNSASFSGAVYVFIRSGGVWSQEAYLKASNTEADDRFGSSVSLFGDTLAVGAFGEDSNTTGVNGNQVDNSASFSGAVYVFVRGGGLWSQQAYLKASNTGADDWFGFSVLLSGDTLAVGAPEEASNATGVNGNQADNSAFGSGAVYVFVRSGSQWSQQAYLKASNTGAGDDFGSSVSLSGDTLAVGAVGEDSNAIGVNGNQADNNAPSSGAVYVFARSGSQWSPQAYLKASNTGANDFFGSIVSLSGDTMAVGARREDSNATGVHGNQADNSAQDSGAVYVFSSR